MYLLTRRALVEDCKTCDGEGQIPYTEEELAALEEKAKGQPSFSGCVSYSNSYKCTTCNGEGFIVIEELKSKKQYLDDDDE